MDVAYRTLTLRDAGRRREDFSPRTDFFQV
jgi:hypothetical protein